MSNQPFPSLIKSSIVCFTGGLFFFYQFIQLMMFNALNHELMKAFSLTATQLGLLAATSLYANVIFLFPAGILLDRFSTRNIMLVTFSLCVLGTFIFAVTHHVGIAIVALFISGIGSAFCFLAPVRLVSRWFPPHHMAFVIGAITTMGMLGGMLAQTPFVLLIQDWGWRKALLFDVGLGFFILFLIYLFIRDYPKEFKHEQDEQHHTLERLGFVKSLKQAFGYRQNWLAAVYTCTLNLPIVLLGAIWGEPYLEQVDHLSKTTASNVISMIFFGMIIGAPFVGWFSDKIGRRKLPMLFGGGLALLLIIIVILYPEQPIINLLIIFFLLGFASSFQIISYPTVTESNPAYITATAVSVVSFTTQGGASILQPFFGELMDWGWDGQIFNHLPVYSVSDFQRGMLLLPVAFFVAVIAAFFLKETYGRPITPLT